MSDGASEGEHTDSALRQWELLGKRPKRAAAEAESGAPDFPEEIDHVWAWFCEITGGVSGGLGGPPVITWRDIAAWRSLTGTLVEPWEARAITALSVLRAEIISEKPRGAQKRS